MSISDWWNATWDSIETALGGFWDHLGDVLGALIILLVGLIIASLLKKLVVMMVDRLELGRLANQARLNEVMDTKMSWTGLLGDLTWWLVVLTFLLPALMVAGLDSDADVYNFLGYVPTALVGGAVVFVGFVFADILSRVAQGMTHWLGTGSSMVVGHAVRYAVLVVTGLAALRTFGVPERWVENIILAVVAGGALAFGLSLGLGGRDSGAGVLKRWGSLWPK